MTQETTLALIDKYLSWDLDILIFHLEMLEPQDCCLITGEDYSAIIQM